METTLVIGKDDFLGLYEWYTCMVVSFNQSSDDHLDTLTKIFDGINHSVYMHVFMCTQNTLSADLFC